MPVEQAIRLLKDQAAKTAELSGLAYDDPQVGAWENFTEQLIIKAFGKPHGNLDAYHMARIGGPVRFGMSWAECQENHVNAMRKLKPLLLSFAGQLETFGRTEEAEVAPAVSKEVSLKIFVVHGHAEQPKAELALFLTRLGLEPVILHEQPNQGLTLIEKLERHSEVGYAFVLLTPDDFGGPMGQAGLMKEARPRARQNVVFEFGRFVGLLERSRVCCLYTGNVELPSDVQGLAYIAFKESVNEVQLDIVKELRAAGYNVKI